MNQFALASWLENEQEWWWQMQGNLWRSESGRTAYKHALKLKHVVEAESLDDAKIKFAVGAFRYHYVNKGKCVFDAGLTEGDHTAIRRTAAMILRQLSDEAIEFLLVTGGVTPANTADARLQQLRSKIIGAA